GENDQPPGDEPRVLPRLHHPGEVVHRGVGVRAAQALDVRADDVVVLVTVPVVPGRRLVDGPLDGREVDRGGAGIQRGAGRSLQARQRAAGVTAGDAYEVLTRVLGELHRGIEA